MPTYTEIIEEFIKMVQSINDTNDLYESEKKLFERLKNEYYILKSMEKSE